MSPIALAFCLQQAVLKDVHILATPLDKAVEKISKLYNDPMDVSLVLRDKVVIIDATQVSEEELRNQLAQTFNATWELKKETGWHLFKTTQQQKDDSKKSFQSRLRNLTRMSDLRKKESMTDSPFSASEATQTYQSMRNAQQGSFILTTKGPEFRTPEQRLMTRFLAKFGLDRIAAVGNGERMVFAAKPNQMQAPLNVDLNDDISKFYQETETWNAAIRKLEPSNQNGNNVANSSDIRPDYIFFTVYCDQSMYQLELFGFSLSTKDCLFFLSASSTEGIFSDISLEDLQRKPDKDFKLSPSSENFLQFLGDDKANLKGEPRKAFTTLLAEPLVSDPLSFGCSESLIFDARKLKHNLIALVGDSAINIAEPIFGETYFNDKFKNFSEDYVSKDDKWIRFNLTPFEESNLNRREMKRLITRIRSVGKMNLQDRADLAAMHSRSAMENPIETYLEKFGDSSRDEQNDPDTIRVLGLLHPDELNRASSPNGIPFSQLNPKLQQHLFECAYYNYRTHLFQIKDNPSNVLAGEPTCIAPDGLANSTLVVSQIREDMIKESDTEERQGFYMSATGWGAIKYLIDQNNKDFQFDIDKRLYRLTRMNYQFRLVINPNCQWTGNLQWTSRPDSQTFTIANWPSELKEEFQKGYQNAAKAAKDEENRKDGGDPPKNPNS